MQFCLKLSLRLNYSLTIVEIWFAGTPINKEKMIQLYPNTPAMHPIFFFGSVLVTSPLKKLILNLLKETLKLLQKQSG